MVTEPKLGKCEINDANIQTYVNQLYTLKPQEIIYILKMNLIKQSQGGRERKDGLHRSLPMAGA